MPGAHAPIEGFQKRGADVPWLNPWAIKIVGLDMEDSSTHWFAFCPRAEEPLEPEWIEDIRTNGVRTPVDVYKDGSAVVMLEGRRRVRAARIVWDQQKAAGVPESERIAVRCAIRTGTPLQLYKYNVGSENRKNRTHMQRALLMLNAQKHSGASEKDLAEAFDCDPQTVKNTLSLLQLEGSLQRALGTGDLPLREAIKLAKLPREDQKATYKEMEAAGATKGAAAANAIEAKKRGEKIERADKTRMRSKLLIEKFRAGLKKAKGHEEILPWLDFILGGPPPAGEDIAEVLAEAGFKVKKPKEPKPPKAPKPPKVPKEKKVKEPKPPKPPKEKKVKAAKEPKAKKSKKQ